MVDSMTMEEVKNKARIIKAANRSFIFFIVGIIGVVRIVFIVTS